MSGPVSGSSTGLITPVSADAMLRCLGHVSRPCPGLARGAAPGSGSDPASGFVSQGSRPQLASESQSQAQSKPWAKRFGFWKRRACVAENMAWEKRAYAWDRRLQDARAVESGWQKQATGSAETLELQRARALQVAVETELRKTAKRDARARRVRERLARESVTFAARRRVGKASLAALKDRIASRARVQLAEPRREIASESAAVSPDVARSDARRRTLESFMNRRVGGS